MQLRLNHLQVTDISIQTNNGQANQIDKRMNNISKTSCGNNCNTNLGKK